jgi:hypothetical protein
MSAEKKASTRKAAAVNSNRVPMGQHEGHETFYNTETRRFEADVNGQTVDRASQTELESAVERLASGRRVIVARPRSVVSAVLVGKQGESYLFGDGSTVKADTAVYEFDEAAFKTISGLMAQAEDAKQKYAELCLSIGGRIEKAFEGLEGIDADSVEEVARPARGRKAAPVEEEVVADGDDDGVDDSDEELDDLN